MTSASARKQDDAAAADTLSPAMSQWWATKNAHPECLVFFRMGDFYEMFFDDAVAAAGALDIALTKRGTHKGEPVAMAGVPVHAADQYLSRLIRKGFRVAICDQMEDPAAARKRGAKAVVHRAVTRIITPGTLTEDGLLDARQHNHLAALADVQGALAMAWLDMSTGAVWLQPLGPGGGGGPGGGSEAAAALAAALARVAPGELLVPERLLKQPALFELFGEHKAVLTPLPDSRFDSTNGRRRLEALYDVKALDAFGPVSRAEVAAAGALVDYVELTQVGRLPRLDRPRRLPPPGSAGAAVEIDPATRRNLELVRTLGGERQGSLLSVIDATVTGAGARALAADLLAPLTDPAAINARLDAVGFFVAATRLRETARGVLRHCPDIERPLSRLSVERGGPRDLAAIRDALAQAQALRAALADHEPAGRELAPLPPRLAGAVQDLGFHETLVERLTRALGAELPLLARDGGFVAAGYNDELDGQRELRDASRRLIAGLQAGYVEMTGVPSLKVRHNNVLGYYVEVTAAHGDKLLQRGGGEGPFIHRQTMANAMRFTTVELAELQDKINRAADRAVAIELRLFADLAGEVLARAEEIARTARALAVIDVAGALAEVAVERRYCRPVVDDSLAFAITAGRHPVVEAALAGADGGAFVANDCALAGDARLWLVTGPNMAGKSTFLRQNALIAALAQIGAYVPAEAAHIGVVDRLFSRVGAADDLARGRSTFMVEMVETAMILNHATDRSLVILDEIGRGTATFDGLSIAWATVEQLHEVNRCRTLFATHYHELTSLAARLPAVSCHSMRVKEWQGDVVFLHEVAPGTADRSYGIHVARLAGLPLAAVARAEEVLALLEQGDQGSALTRLAEDLPLFQAAAQVARAGAGVVPAGAVASKVSALETALGEINPDALSPREALELIYRLKELVNG